MRSFTPLLLSLLGASAAVSASEPAAAAAAEAAADSNVHVLTADNFNDFVKEHELVLAEFYAPWCGHCKALAPKYEEAATELKGKNIPLAKVDCTTEEELCRTYEVDGYPTLKVFRGPDSHKPYTGARQTDSIVSYMTKQSMPAISMLTEETLEEFKTMDKIVIVGYLGADDKATNKSFTTFAESQRDNYLFGASNDAALAKAEGVKQPSIVLYKDFDEKKAVYEGKQDLESILAWVTVASTPLVGELGPETYSKYMASGIPLAYIFAETAEEREKYAEEFRPIAEKHRGEINIVTLDAKAFGAHAGNLNLEPEKFPAFAIQQTDKNAKYPYDQTKKIDAKEIGKFIKDVLAGKIEPSIKSEPIPEGKDGSVTIIVGKNYQEVVMDDEKDVLVEFYAPWCGHCKALAPKYEELAALYANNDELKDKIVVAKVDATANDVPDSITGFPTIKLFPAGKKEEAVEYAGDRTVEDLVKFIKENGKYQADGLAGGKKATEGGDVTSAPSATATKVVETPAVDEDMDVHDEL
ncbi:Protein disulfide-isomerase [Penicillium diatomitis]|uniref:Protein disulfide-isomerase n=1 Tax=Penicillium diatomitis TaxID=2819901 RepID=A0A9W9WT63_9EURO|nr:Protein disulfide-isomerase [Penicillium diatomitis]KAJ5475039.1 Protein disulfide-isomerase [Penicillium diatomitis]